MAHKNPIASWLYKNSDRYGIRFKLADWTTKHGFELFDYQVTGEFQGIKLSSRGIDDSKEIALEKASSEFLEHMICVAADLNSEGMAVSASVDAALHAKNECLERYYLRKHLSDDIGFRRTDYEKEQPALKIEKQLNCSIDFFELKTSGEGFGIVCRIQSYNKSEVFSFGFSYSDSLVGSAEKSLLEALPNYIWKMENPDSSTENIWQISNDFKNRISSLLGKNCAQEISAPNINQVLIDTNNLFCKEIDGLMACKYTAT